MKLYNFTKKNFRRTILFKNRNVENDFIIKEKKETFIPNNNNSKQIKYQNNDIQFIKSKSYDEYNDFLPKNNLEKKNNKMILNQNIHRFYIRKSIKNQSNSERINMNNTIKDNIFHNNINSKFFNNKSNIYNEYNICLNEFSSRNFSSNSILGYDTIKKNPIIKDLIYKLRKYPSSKIIKKSSILYQKRKSVINDLLLSTYNEKDKHIDVFNNLNYNDNVITPSFSNSFISNKISINEYKKKINFFEHLDLKLYPDTTKNEKQKFRQQKKLITPYSYKILQNKINQIILNKNQIENSIQVFNKKFKVNNNEAKKKFSKNNNLDKSIDSNEKINHPNHLMKENIYKNDKLNDIITNNYNSSLNNKIKLGEKKNIDYCNSNELTSSLDNNNCLFCKLTSKYY